MLAVMDCADISQSPSCGKCGCVLRIDDRVQKEKLPYGSPQVMPIDPQVSI